jgi:hypothetical protein
MAMTRDDLNAMVLALPETEAGTAWGKPAFKTNGKYLARLRADDNSVTVTVADLEWRDMLLEADPAVFHITDHYRGYPVVLARLETVDPEWLRAALTARWRKLATKAAVKAFDALASAGSGV